MTERCFTTIFCAADKTKQIKYVPLKLTMALVTNTINMNENLRAWAQKVIDSITPIAEKFDTDFYPLQSPMLEKPQVLILGLNPGGGYTYNSQKVNWKFEGDRMSVDQLLRGNPTFESESNTWSYIKGLKKFSFIRELLDQDEYILMNYYYLSTSRFVDVAKEHKDALDKCKDLTFELIDLLKPSLILVMGTANGIDFLPFENKRTVRDGHKQRLLVKGNHKDIPVFAIPHPSWLAITSAEIEAIDVNLKEGALSRPLTKFEFQKINLKTAISIDEINEKLHDSSIHFEEAKAGQFDCIIDGLDEKLLIRIVPQNRYWGLRDAMPVAHKHFENLKNEDIYIGAITEPKILKQQSWLVKKEFKMYAVSKQEDLGNLVAEDIRSLVDAINIARPKT